MSTKKKEIRQKFRDDCLERDKHTCRLCTCQNVLDVHHITDRKEMPNGGYVKENGITLCQLHHELAEVYHRSGGKNHIPNLHPNDLYNLIGSSYEEAVAASQKL